MQFSKEYHAIDVHSTKFVKQVGDYVSNTIHDIFSKGPKVPKVYSQMEKVITNWNVHHQAKPLITWECFINSLQPRCNNCRRMIKGNVMVLHELGQVLSIDEACHIEMHQKKLTIKNDIIKRYKLKEFILNSISIKIKFQPFKGCTNIILNSDNLIEAMIKMHLYFEQDLPNTRGDRLP